MFFGKFLKRNANDKYPDTAKYKKGDFVRFRYRDEVTHGFVYSAVADADGRITYTLQMGGECPSFAYNYAECDVIGYVKK